jgi:hypothetical protein
MINLEVRNVYFTNPKGELFNMLICLDCYTIDVKYCLDHNIVYPWICEQAPIVYKYDEHFNCFEIEFEDIDFKIELFNPNLFEDVDTFINSESEFINPNRFDDIDFDSVPF